MVLNEKNSNSSGYQLHAIGSGYTLYVSAKNLFKKYNVIVV